ncbi:MAG: hypothetical protein K2P58_09035 [Hyphomonadaceae bacterium]|nr:hypothetical protein [Hyphomonadaceae bacterium]
MARSFIDKHDHHKHPVQVERLDKAFAGLQPGQTIVIATPKDFSAAFKRVPAGKLRSIEAVRASLATKYGADAACPLTSGIFARIAAEAALERIAAGAKASEVAPFWRVIDPDSPLAEKLSCGPDFIREMRALEGAAGKSKAKPNATKRKASRLKAKKSKRGDRT